MLLWGGSSAAAACTLYKAVAVCTFRNCWIFFMCADVDRIKGTVILCHHVMLTLGDGTLYAVVFVLVFHF